MQKARKSEGWLISGKALFGQLYIPRAAFLVAVNSLKQQMSWSSNSTVKPELWDEATLREKPTSFLFIFVPLTNCFLSLLDLNELRKEQGHPR